MRARFSLKSAGTAVGLSHEAFTELGNQTVTVCQQKLAHYTLSMAEVSELISLLSSTEVLTEEARQGCFRHVNKHKGALQASALIDLAAHTNTGAKHQSLGFLANFFPASH